jgi:hypothetical protein
MITFWIVSEYRIPPAAAKKSAKKFKGVWREK